MGITVGRTASVALIMEYTILLRTGIPFKAAEKAEQIVLPDLFEGGCQDVSEPEFGKPEEQIARIDRSIG